MKRRVTALLLAGCAAFLGACEDDLVVDGQSHWLKIIGRSSKGPYAKKSAIRATLVDDALNAVEGRFSEGEVADNLGRFSQRIVVDDGRDAYIHLVVDGQYYDEVSGKMSSATLSLESIVTVSSDETSIETHPNVLTHMVTQRVRVLVAEGKTVAEGLRQAEQEIILALGIGPLGLQLEKSVADIDLLRKDDSDSAYLLLVSATLLALSGGDEALFAQQIADLRNDFADDGLIAAEQRQKLTLAQTSIDAAAIADNLARHVESNGGNSSDIPDIVGYVEAIKNTTTSFDQLIAELPHRILPMDVLIVVDNSLDTGAIQRTFADAWKTVFSFLDEQGVDYRIGVITTDVGAGPFTEAVNAHSGTATCGSRKSGLLRHVNEAETSCDVQMTDSWIAVDGTSLNVQQGTALQALHCLMDAGEAGCGFEQPLEAARFALVEKDNRGFFREDAGLVVVHVTNEDDCSALPNGSIYNPDGSVESFWGPLTSYRCFEFGMSCDVNDRNVPGLRSNCTLSFDYLTPFDGYQAQMAEQKPHNRWLVATFAGPPEPPITVSVDNVGGIQFSSVEHVCVVADDSVGGGSSAVTTEIHPTPRLRQFVSSLGEHGVAYSLCESLEPQLDDLDQRIATQLSDHDLSWCVGEDLVDTDSCEVLAENMGVLQPCDAALPTQACYRFVQGGDCLNAAPRIAIRRTPSAALGSSVSVRCSKFVP